MTDEYVEDVYDDSVDESADDTKEKLLEDDELTPAEEGFLRGYEEDIEEKEEDLDREFE